MCDDSLTERALSSVHDIQVDQSGRTDVLTTDTALAFSDGIQAAILIPASAKRECYQRLKARGVRKRLIGIKMFAGGLVLLLEPYLSKLQTITIDQEYVGWEATIKEHLLRRLRERGSEITSRQIVFRQIGKGARAHSVALATYRGIREPDRRLSAEELLAVC